MQVEIKDGVAIITDNEIIITDVNSALDLIATISYNYNVNKAIINKSAISEEFFDLRTGFAGEVAQKFVQYNMTLAIVGDYSGYKSKALHDYMYECNNGKHLFFVSSEEEAVEKLGE